MHNLVGNDVRGILRHKQNERQAKYFFETLRGAQINGENSDMDTNKGNVAVGGEIRRRRKALWMTLEELAFQIGGDNGNLSRLERWKQARISPQGRDRYGRTIGRIYCFTPGVKTEIDANAEQVRRGLAWVYDRYVTDSDLYPLQDAARAERRGLWADSAPTPPWEWRKARR